MGWLHDMALDLGLQPLVPGNFVHSTLLILTAGPSQPPKKGARDKNFPKNGNPTTVMGWHW